MRAVVLWVLDRLQGVLDTGGGMALAWVILRHLGYDVRVTRNRAIDRETR